MPRKPEINVNLVLDDGAYKIVDTVELTRLMAQKQIVFEKVLKQNNVFGHFYRKIS